MKNRFVLIIDGADKQQQDVISNYFKDHSFGYWHYIKDTWLLVDYDGTWTVSTIRAKARELLPDINLMIVLKVDDSSAWAGLGNKGNFDWLNDTWV